MTHPLKNGVSGKPGAVQLAVAAEPAALIESAARGIANAASVAGQEAAAAHLEYQAGNTDQGNIDALSALESGAVAFDEAAAVAVAPQLVEAAPGALASSSLTGSGLTLTAGKTAVGFGLGYFGAKETGTVSTAGDVAAGITGAAALNLGSLGTEYLTEYLPALGKFGNTAIVSGVAGGVTELNAQTADYVAGNSSSMDFSKVGYVGVTTSIASLTMGEAALTAAADYAELGRTGQTITQSVGAGLTGLGSFVADKIWEGTTGSTNSSSGMTAGGDLISPNTPSGEILWNAYPK